MKRDIEQIIDISLDYGNEIFLLVAKHCTSAEVISEYKKACEKLKTKPIEKLVRQIQVSSWFLFRLMC